MKHEIEIPDLPYGWEAVAYRVPVEGEYFLGRHGIDQATDDWPDRPSAIIVRKKHPRRIVLEETGETRRSCYLLKIDDGNLILPPGREYKIVEDNQCAE